VGSLVNSDLVAEHTFWVGVYPGLDEQRVDWIAESVRDFAAKKS
jgi:dTDP-4-dehydro-2,6-dideoxy-D-glucose 3-dehydratase